MLFTFSRLNNYFKGLFMKHARSYTKPLFLYTNERRETEKKGDFTCVFSSISREEACFFTNLENISFLVCIFLDKPLLL